MTHDLFSRLRKLNISIRVIDNNLDIKAPKGALTKELVQEIKANKSELIQLINQYTVSSNKENKTIPTAPKDDSYPLSSSQNRLWVLSQIEEANTSYNIPGIQFYNEDIDETCFRASFQKLIERHEILRTVFRENKAGEVRQFIQSKEDFNFELTKVDLRSSKEYKKEIDKIIRQQTSKSFDLSKGPLLEGTLIHIADQKWAFCYVMHHIISDGWSIDIMIKELMENYARLIHNNSVDREELRIQYKDYAVWQQDQLTNDFLATSKNYWLNEFEGEIPVLAHFGDYSRPSVKTYNGRIESSILNAKVTEEFRSFCNQEEGTLFMGCVGLVNVLLHKYTHQTDLVIGSPIAGRTHTDLQNQIGFYVNTLALRTKFQKEDSFKEIFEKTKEVTFGALRNQEYPFDQLINDLDLKTDLSRNALFDVMISLQSGASEDNSNNEEDQTDTIAAQTTSKYDLTFTFCEIGDQIKINLEYNTDIYSQQTAQQLLIHLEQLLTMLLQKSTQSIASISCLTAEEITNLLEVQSGDHKTCPVDWSIPTLFANQVVATPDNVALVYQENTYTYQELDEVSSQFSHYLQSNYDLTKGDLIALSIPKNDWHIIAILGILKTGCAYVPIDQNYPQERIDFILKDIQSTVVIDHLEVTKFQDEQSTYHKNESIVSLTKNDVAYVMYTSGSTGTPKGVLVEQGSVARLVKDCNYVDLQGKETLLSTGSASFDATTFEYWSMLLNGGKLVLCNQDTLLSSENLAEIIQAQAIDTMWFTAGFLNQLVDEDIQIFEGLKTILAGGDRLSSVHIQKLLDRYPTLHIINGYGPTENTTFSLTHAINSPVVEDIPIGSPISKSTVYILDEEGNLLPNGVIGEICLGGEGLSRGYLNQKGLTADKFKVHPFNPKEIIYKTGDLGKWLHDGTVAFVGRKDSQVKIRGYRIELGSIEHALTAHNEVNEAAVVAIEDLTGDKILVAYLVGAKSLQVSDLKIELSKQLPSYMIPSHFEVMDQFPLNRNGKVDRKSLPIPDFNTISNVSDYQAPTTEIEKVLATIWEELLGVDRVGLRDNFFDLGGHSLKATRLISQVNKKLGVRLQMKDLFANPHLQSQSQLIAKGQQETYKEIPAIAQQESYPLSITQRRLWILSQFEEANVAYNIPGVYVFEGQLDFEALENAFKQLMVRHEVLRTKFQETASKEVAQYILSPDAVDFQLDYADFSKSSHSDTSISTDLATYLKTPFDLSTGPLMRAKVYKQTEEKWVFCTVIHHIISDGWSMKVLVNELLTFYNALLEDKQPVLEPLRIHYKDYASWQTTELSGDSLNEHKTYWLEKFSGELPVLDISGGKVRPAIKTFNGGVYNTLISAETSQKLTNYLKEKESTLFMGLLSAVKILFYHYTHQEDIIIGSPIAGREHADLENQIGFYVNTLALRTQFSKEDNFSEVLDKVKQTVLGAHDHQLYPFDDLVQALGHQRDMSRNPLFDVQVIVENKAVVEKGTPTYFGDLTVSHYESEVPNSSVFDLVFNFIESDEGLAISAIYNSDVLDKSRVAQLCQHLEQLLDNLLENPETQVGETNYLSSEEQHRLLHEFNAQKFDYDKTKTVVDLIETQAKQTPDAIAVSFEEKSLTYKELNERSNQLAHFLKSEYQVQPNDLVGLMLDRSENIFIAILAILKSGAAYVPVDPEYPTARKEYIIKDTATKVLLTQSEYIFDLDYYSGAVFAMDLQLEMLETSIEKGSLTNSPDNLAYIIYTSGSTGNPKGVLVSHANLMHSLAPRKEVYQPIESFLLLSSVAFDSSVAGIFSTLTSGGKLCITQKADVANVSLISEIIIREKVSHLLTVPSYYKLVLAELSDKETHLKEVTVAGEICPIRLIEDHYASNVGTSGCILFNEYGPTECTVWSSVHQYQAGEPISSTIGKPIANTSIYILDQDEQMVAEGVIGELCVGGEGVAQGYLNQPEMTAKKFVANPFIEGTRMYKTGDLARWKSNGEIEFLGRKDDQVKIRGYRIELGEIQKALESHSDINSAVVLAKENSAGDNELFVYFTHQETCEISKVKEYLTKQLPSYAVPSNYIPLEEFPVTPNGKIDSKALLAMDHQLNNDHYVPASTPVQEQLVSIWESVLDKKPIGIHDHFFDLGGDSIKVLKIVNEIYTQLQLEITISDIYTRDTVSELSEYIEDNKISLKELKEEHTEAKEKVLKDIEAIKKDVLNALNQEVVDTIEDVYPMSDIQKGMIYESLLDQSTHVYHDQMINQRQFVDFNISTFQRAMDLMVEKHEMLRTSFHIQEFEQEVQIVHKQVNIPVFYEDISEKVSQKEKEDHIQKFLTSELQNPFDVTKAPLFRMAVFHIGDNHFVFASQCHHAIIDGWSDSMLLTELNNIYVKLQEDADFIPSKIRSNYKDFIIQHCMDEKEHQPKEFWKQELEGYNKLDFFTKEVTNRNKAFSLETDVIEQVEKLKKDQGITSKELSLSAFLYTLSMLNNQEDVTIGVVTNTRPNVPDAEKILGCFLNTIPFRLAIDRRLTGNELMALVKEKLIELNAYSKMSLSEISALHPQSKDQGNPFFDILFNYVNFYEFQNAEAGEVPEVKEESSEGIELALMGAGITNTFLNFRLNDSWSKYAYSFTQTRALTNETELVEVEALFKKVLNFIAQNPEKSLAELNHLDEKSFALVIDQVQENQVNFSEEVTVIDLFKKQVELHPTKTALVYEDKEVSYAVLEERSSQLAHYLINKGVREEDFVAVYLDRSIEMVVTILGILKSGAAYVPLDTSFPTERVNYILKDARAKVLVCNTLDAVNELKLGETQVVSLQEEKSEIHKASSIDVQSSVSASNLMYAIYTSGTTGKPKGVLVEHRGVVNLLDGLTKEYAITEKERFVSFSNYIFDASVEQIFLSLVNGASLVLCSKETILDSEAFQNLLQDQKITHLHGTPSYISNLQPDSYHLNRVVFGGEVCSVSLAKSWEAYTSVYNKYGPTETTVSALIHKYNTTLDTVNVPIGKPIQNVNTYVLDSVQSLVRDGIVGELYIGGAGVARAYLNKPELTQQKFISNPFLAGDTLYRTGDLVKRVSNGNLEYVGRIDEQVKINGYRVELAEIENALEAIPEIKNSAVLIKESQLIAYVTAEKDIDATEVRSLLEEVLPIYMVPSYIIQIDVLPLTLNGKINKKQLTQRPLASLPSEAKEAPISQLEQDLALIWEELLNIDITIGRKDSFFVLGGHSLKAIQLLNKIRRKFDVTVSIKEIFDNPVLKDMATLIESGQKVESQEIPTAKIQSSYPLSSAQQRMWFLSQLDEGNTAYNMPSAYVFEGNFNPRKLECALNKLVEKYEILRTVFRKDSSEEVRQFILHTTEITNLLEQYDLRFQNEIEVSVKERIKNEFTAPFDLTKGSLLRTSLYQIEDYKWVFAMTMHHIISDGWSMQIFMKELVALYNAKESETINPLRIQYKDYAVWQQNNLKGGILEKQKAYWLDQFKGEIPVLERLGDKTRPAFKTFNGALISDTIESTVSQEFKTLLQKEQATLYMGVLSIVNTLIYRYTDQEDIIIGTPIVGRGHIDAHDQIGLYVNTLALRNQFTGKDSYRNFLKQVRQQTLDAYDNQAYPFDEIVNELDLNRDLSRNALFDVMVSLGNMDTEHSQQNKNIALEGLSISQYSETTETVSKFDLSFDFMEVGDELLFNLEYNTDIFTDATAKRITEHIKELIKSVVQNPDNTLCQLNYLGNEEVQKLDQVFNKAIIKNTEENETVISLFEKQVQLHPESIAIVYDTTELTYATLNEKANQLAQLLIEKGIEKEEKVAIYLDRSPETIISILGILKAGAAYVPIDISTPVERVDFILEDAKARFVLVRSESQSAVFENRSVTSVNVKEIESREQKTFEIQNSPNDLMYVIYTSGTTGVPKGVLVANKGIVNLIKSQTETFGIDDQEVILNFSNYVFDASVEQIFLALLNGAKLVLPTEEQVMDTIKLEKLLVAQKITHLDVTPSYLTTINPEKYALNRIVVGGEACPLELAEKWSSHIAFYNAYGPTETSVTSIVHKYEIDHTYNNKLPIGKAIRNTNCYILDESLSLRGIGVIGELYIGGEGVTRGYLNQPELSNEKFIQSPFQENEILYKTGDLVKWLNDGSIEYIGRIDDQVKVRGYRIELGEIEEALLKDEEIQSANVLVTDDVSEEKELSAYVVGNEDLDIVEVKTKLKKVLPHYMIPHNFIRLTELPYTTSGKVDRKKLKELKGNSTAKEIILPKDEKEATLLQIWKEILSKDTISVTDNFFDIGGHSLKAIKLQSLVKRSLGQEISIKDIYNAPTIREMAAANQSHSSLLTLHKGEHPRTIYFIPPVIGNAAMYMPLAKFLKNEYNSFGLQYKGLEVNEGFHKTIEAIAFDFANEIQQQQKDKDEQFIVLGYSLGATIAFEVTKILEKQYSNIDLVLVDRPTNTLKGRKDIDNIKLETDWLVQQYQQLIGFESDQKEHIASFLMNNIKLDNNYQLHGTIESDIHLLESKNNDRDQDMTTWQDFTHGVIHHGYIQGTHWEAFSEINFAAFQAIFNEINIDAFIQAT